MGDLGERVRAEMGKAPSGKRDLNLCTADGTLRVVVSRPWEMREEYIGALYVDGKVRNAVREVGLDMQRFLRAVKMTAIDRSALSLSLRNGQELHIDHRAVPALNVHLYDVGLVSGGGKPGETGLTKVLAKVLNRVYGLAIMEDRYRSECSPAPFRRAGNGSSGIVLGYGGREYGEVVGKGMARAPTRSGDRILPLRVTQQRYEVSAEVISGREPLTNAPFLMLLAALPRETTGVSVSLTDNAQNRYLDCSTTMRSGDGAAVKVRVDFEGKALDAIIGELGALGNAYWEIAGKKRVVLRAQWE